jgi:hypothetical protein
MIAGSSGHTGIQTHGRFAEPASKNSVAAQKSNGREEILPGRFSRSTLRLRRPVRNQTRLSEIRHNRHEIAVNAPVVGCSRARVVRVGKEIGRRARHLL